MFHHWKFRTLLTVFFITLFLTHPIVSQAFTPEADPQYVVMNFSAMNELNWAAPEAEWQAEIKPQIVKELDQFLATLPKGTPERQLAWSTLLEYMNFPLDEATPDSPYVIKVRRIFEISAEKNIPVFFPLNGFQWWDELPELYNWWDPDGTNTSAAFFKRQDNPEEFKRRFIAGYDPENKWNVEWQDWNTPMQLNWRNWGGGEFRLAPPPNIGKHSKAKRTYRQVQEQRFKAIVQQIHDSVNELEAQGKKDLFAGLSIGTEVSLNASVTKKDEFMPYGYKAMTEQLCPDLEEECIRQSTPSAKRSELRKEAVTEYLDDLSFQAVSIGIPKQRIYTHVWGEADVTDPKYQPYALAAFNLYSRPGMSFYGFAEDPYNSKSWRTAQTTAGLPHWGAVEYSVPNSDKALSALQNTLDPVAANSPPAKVIVLYNWSEHKDTLAIPALQTILQEKNITPQCVVPELELMASPTNSSPIFVKWKTLFSEETIESKNTKQLTLHILLGDRVTEDVSGEKTVELPLDKDTALFPELSPGSYVMYVENSGCIQQKKQSQPVTFSVKELSWWRNTQWWGNAYEAWRFARKE